ncbi:MAG: hypothetical protein A2Z91_04945 [Deltaproteobacteria bacterium GWA2_38_16]|nr:MAG: hypothetical protein A2Z91_04945 [Deltaproteobacteria bacterium GWA2_38_16]OGQ03129.1 MAG: hypothetical protein A3D19_03675 [Deltaproteobacteria bacterium RIFCSPHIGHO2_02_FULL_38_15]OGQ30012.1 MAG: hypothetical protein A3A72_09035 [Deltaproteobacteria bacterium RIFCSPLOWO2_01_FULL_38_9]OGQ61729.1 MAG: hypothetical protein A3G92_01695 [Deltaproteobacteria bacterium RIFCSPLOWO2_12_FULL_38_8]HBQ20451.1 hypothetical protein [Deltaproteobacteria bacterium]
MKNKLPKDSLSFIIEGICKILEDKQFKIILFGSFVSGKTSRLSDIDIAISSLKPLDSAKMAFMKEYFEESNFPYSVDLVDLSRVSKVFREKILQEGDVIYSTSVYHDNMK